VNVDGSRDRRRVISPDAVEQLVSREQDAPMLDEVLEQEKSPRNLALDEQICQIEREVLRQVRPDPTWKLLKTVWGIGPILATTIRLGTGELARFAEVGDFVSYCRCVKSERTSNGKKEGEGNTKNGNQYLAWAFIEAANFSIRHYEVARRYYQRKVSKTNTILARKALAHKLARASFFVMRDQTRLPRCSTRASRDSCASMGCVTLCERV
jgi:transposase